jgi:hypothetical protein
MQLESVRRKKRKAHTDSASAPKPKTAAGVPAFLKALLNLASPHRAAREDSEAGFGAISTKSESGDRPTFAPEHYEHDADRLAEESLHPLNTGARREAAAENTVSETAPITPVSSAEFSGRGDPLSEAERSHFERSMNADFSDVLVHHDGDAARAADSLDALAFTENQNIAFGPGQYQPETSKGRKLLAHELAHVKQQSTGEAIGVQRQPKPNTAPQAPPPTTVPEEAHPTNDYFNREDVQAIQGRTVARYFKTSMTVSTGVQTIEKIKGTLMEANERYNEAYTNYSAAISAAGKEARNQQEWRDIFLGLAVGVTLGLGSELLLPEAASRALEIGVEIGAEVAEGGIGMGVKYTGWTTVVGQDLQPPRGLDPMVMELDIYRLIETLHQRVFDVARLCDAQFMINDAAEFAIGEIKAHVAGGEQELSELDLFDLIDTLVAADQAGSTTDRALLQLDKILTDIKSRVESAPRQTVKEMEQDIWILWLSSISDNESDTVDLDAIEDRLLAVGVIGPSSRLNVDFGYYTSKDDELAALKAARDAAPEIAERRQKLTSR